MGALRPYDRLAVTPAAEHKSLPGCGCSKIGGHQFPVLHLVAQTIYQLLPLGIIFSYMQIMTGFLQCRVIFRHTCGQHSDKCHKSLTGMFRIRNPYLLVAALDIDQRSPCLDLFHIFHHQHTGANFQCPFQHYPRKRADVLVDGLSASCFGEMLAVGACPQQSHRPALADRFRIHIPHGCLIVLCPSVICRMLCDGVGIVVHSCKNGHTYSLLYTHRSPATAGKQVNKYFLIKPGLASFYLFWLHVFHIASGISSNSSGS